MALRGNLRDFGLPDVFQLIQLSRKSGVLRIKAAEAEGAIWFRDGDVFFAQSNWRRELLGQRLVAAGKITPSALARALEMRGAEPPGGRRLGQILVDEGYITQQVLEAFVQEQIQDTIFDIMRWDEGEFDFEVLPEVIQEDIGLAVSVENIVMEGSRRLEEWDRIRKRVPSTDMVFRMATAPGEGTFEISLTPAEWNLLLLMDGTRSVRELAVATRRTDFEVARIIYGLFSAGLLEVAEPAEVESRRADRARRERARLRRPARARQQGPVSEAEREAAASLSPDTAAVSPAQQTAAAAGEAGEPVEVPEFLSRGGEEPTVEDLAAFEQVLEAVLAQAEATSQPQAPAVVPEQDLAAPPVSQEATLEPTSEAAPVVEPQVVEALQAEPAEAAEAAWEEPEAAEVLQEEPEAAEAAWEEPLEPAPEAAESEQPELEVAEQEAAEPGPLEAGEEAPVAEAAEEEAPAAETVARESPAAEAAEEEGPAAETAEEEASAAEAVASAPVDSAGQVTPSSAGDEEERPFVPRPVVPPTFVRTGDLETDLLRLGLGELPEELRVPEEPAHGMTGWYLPEGEELEAEPAEGLGAEPVESLTEPAVVEPGGLTIVPAEAVESWEREGPSADVEAEAGREAELGPEPVPDDLLTVADQTEEVGPSEERVPTPAAAAAEQTAGVPEAPLETREEPAPRLATHGEALDAGLELAGGLADELTALTGAATGRPRPSAKVERLPDPGERRVLRRDSMVDRDLILHIIDGIERL